jgi:hypothetical protein
MVEQGQCVLYLEKASYNWIPGVVHQLRTFRPASFLPDPSILLPPFLRWLLLFFSLFPLSISLSFH